MSSTPPPPVTSPSGEAPLSDDERPQPPDTGQRRTPAALALALVGMLVTLAVIVLAVQWMRETDVNRAVVVLVAIAVGVLGIFALFVTMDRVVDALPLRFQDRIRPWAFVGPALVLLSVFLLYPAINTIVMSFKDSSGIEFIGLDNYRFVLTDDAMLRSLRNTFAWMVVVPTSTVVIGLVFAVLADRLRRGEAIAKSLIFLPMAVSFVGASVVWGFIYDFRAFGNQTGLLNGIWTALGNDPVGWTSLEPWNNLFLMVVMIWMQTGFAMVILSAAIKSVPEDQLEAARIDGAGEVAIFFRIIVPSIMSAIVVVTTTMIINVLKIFDIVFVMTNGESGTEVIAERMIRWFFRNNHDGRGAAIAVFLFIAVIPVMVWNVRRFRAEEEIR